MDAAAASSDGGTEGRRRVPPGGIVRWVVPVVLSIAAHVALLAATGSASTGKSGGSRAAGANVVVQARLDAAPGSSRVRSAQGRPANAASAPIPGSSAPIPVRDSQSGGVPAPERAPPIPILRPDRYYTATEVDRRAYPATPVDPGNSGLGPLDPRAPAKVTLQVWIDEGGHVRDVRVVASNMPSGVAKDAAEAFAAARFQPAMRRGERVKTVIWVEVAYDGSMSPGEGVSAAIGR